MKATNVAALRQALSHAKTGAAVGDDQFAHTSRKAASAQEHCRRYGRFFAVPQDDMTETVAYCTPAEGRLRDAELNGLDLSAHAIPIGRDTDSARAMMVLTTFARRVYTDVANFMGKASKQGRRAQDAKCLRGAVTTAADGLQLDGTVQVDDGTGTLITLPILPGSVFSFGAQGVSIDPRSAITTAQWTMVLALGTTTVDAPRFTRYKQIVTESRLRITSYFCHFRDSVVDHH